MKQELTPIQTEVLTRLDSAQSEVLSRLDAVAAKLGVASEHLWEIFVRQAVIDGAASLGVTALALLIAAIVFAITWPKKWDENNSATLAGVLGVISVGVSLVTIVRIIVYGSDWVTHIFNPEYFAWKEVQVIIS